MTLSLGASIGPYTVLERVGAGGTTAEVYRARDDRIDRIVALKVLPGASDRSHREAAAVATLGHPNIVATLDVIEHRGRLCLVQEWIDGQSLAADLDVAGRLGVQETMRLAHDVASALHHAHQHSILHRDIKPSNVLRTAEGTYKLVDFGAFGQLQVQTALTMAGEIAGTPLYMSPEQITGAPQSPASDLFGLGLLLYRCLHGHLPDEIASSYLELAYRRIQQPISIPPSPFQGLLERCLALDPAQRPQSAADVLTALDELALIRHRQQSTGIFGSQETAPFQPAPPPHDSMGAGWAGAPPPTAPRRWSAPPATAFPQRRSAQWWILFLAGAAVLLMAAVVVLLGIAFDPESASPGAPPGAGIRLLRIGVGLAIVGVALPVAHQIRRRWTSRAPEAERRAVTILFGAGQREELTQSLMIEVDQVVKNLNSLDAKFLGMTVVAMIREYEQAIESADRQAALLNVVTLMEKLRAHFSPWHVRHKDAIATGVAVVGALAGVVGVVSGFLK